MKLKRIRLSRATGSNSGGWHEHPDVSLRKWYLVKHHGQFAAGKFTRQWYGLNFDGFYDAGLQFDKPGTNRSAWQGLWEIIR